MTEAYGKQYKKDGAEKHAKAGIRRLTKLAMQYDSEFAKHSIKAAEQERQLKQKELHTLNARNAEYGTDG